MNTPANADRDAPQARRNRHLLLLIFALFFGSMLLAGVLRFSGWQPPATKSHGELLQPPSDLRGFAPQLVDGGSYAWKPAERIWRILAAPTADCARDCVQLAHDLDVVWRLMGRRADRVHVLWLCAEANCAVPPPLRDDPSLHRLAPDARLRAALPAPSPAATTVASAANTPALYVVDPNGFVILRYPPGADPGGLRADLAKLVKLL